MRQSRLLVWREASSLGTGPGSRQHFGKRQPAEKKPRLSPINVLEPAGTLDWGLLCEQGYCHSWASLYARLPWFVPRRAARLISTRTSASYSATNGNCNRTATALSSTEGTMHRECRSGKIELKSGAINPPSRVCVPIFTVTATCAAGIEPYKGLSRSFRRTAAQIPRELVATLDATADRPSAHVIVPGSSTYISAGEREA